MNNIILDNINIGVLVLNDQYQCIYVNQYISSNFKVNINTSNIKSEYQNVIHPDDLTTDSNKCRLLFLQKQSSTNTCRLRYHNRDYKWVKITRHYNVDNYIHTLENVDDLKMAEVNLHNEKLRNDKDYKHKSTFLANMSHEIRTPLNGIMGMLSLLEDTMLTNEQRDYIDMLRECSNNLMSIINDILDFSKLEAGKVVLDIKCTNLRTCIESAADILSSNLLEKKLEFRYQLDSTIPNTLNLDGNRLKQVLLNLMSNAIKFTDQGSVILSVTRENAEGQMTLKFSFVDTGCGIADTDYDKLFKSFSQLDNTSNIKLNEGTGLGLVICKELVSLMHGQVWLDWSELGMGSRFCFTICTSSCDNTHANAKLDKENSKNNVLENRKVLILDDNRENRLGLVSMVNKWGMIPHTFGSAIEALYMLKLNAYDCQIGLIDVQMPEMSGKEFALKLKKQNDDLNRKHIPLIALSSLDGIKHDYSAYFKGQLIKPVKESKLRDLCIECIENNFDYTNHPYQETIPTELTTELKNSINILVVEDVPINQRVITIFLQKLGFNNIDVVDDGKKCLERLTCKKYDAILLDIRMPVMNGELVFKYINSYYKPLRNKPTSKPIYTLLNRQKPYIIAITAYSQKSDREKYINMGFDQYISKPVNIDHLGTIMNIFMKLMMSN